MKMKDFRAGSPYKSRLTKDKITKNNKKYKIGTPVTAQGISIIYLTWDDKLIAQLCHNFAFRFTKKSTSAKNFSKPLESGFRHHAI